MQGFGGESEGDETDLIHDTPIVIAIAFANHQNQARLLFVFEFVTLVPPASRS